MKLLKRILPFACLGLALLMLVSCGVTIHEGIGKGDAMNKSTDTVWYHASTCYEAVELEKKVGKLVVTDKQSYELYQLPEMDSEKWLATEDKNILYAEGVALPTLSDMAPSAVYFYLDASTPQRLYTMEDEALITKIIGDYTTNESVIYPATTPYKTYRVCFKSDDYAGMYYVLTYVEYASDYVADDVNYGKYFLYDRFDQRFVPIGDEIHVALGIE